MGWITLAIAVLIAILVVVLKLKPRFSNRTDYPYQKNKSLFSPAERSFLGVIDQAVGADYRVMGKVRIADVIGVKPLNDRRAWQRAFNRISAKHFDFVLCDKNDLSVIAVIELDDKSHRTVKRRQRDDFLIGLCSAISLPLVQIPAKDAYSVPDVKKSVLEVIGVDDAHDPYNQEAEEETGTVDAGSAGVSQPQEQKISPSSHDVPNCPKCSSPMVRRKVTKGARAGEEFWGCSKFPKCRGVVPLHAQPRGAVDSQSRDI